MRITLWPVSTSYCLAAQVVDAQVHNALSGGKATQLARSLFDFILSHVVVAMACAVLGRNASQQLRLHDLLEDTRRPE